MINPWDMRSKTKRSKGSKGSSKYRGPTISRSMINYDPIREAGAQNRKKRKK